MRLDKFTTKFQEALSDAQSIALGNDHAYIEPVHVLQAMLQQDDGPKALLQRAGANVPGLLAAAEAAVKRLPQVQGNDQVQGGPELGRVLQATEKEAIKRGDQFIASELFLLAVIDSKGDAAKIAKDNGLTRKSLEAAIEAVRGGQKMDSAEAEGQRGALANLLLRVIVIAMGLVLFASLLVAAMLLALVWVLRAGWARLTGRPVTPWVMGVDPRTGFSKDAAASRRGGILPGAAQVTDVEAREVR
eukprot:gene926-908_t